METGTSLFSGIIKALKDREYTRNMVGPMMMAMGLILLLFFASKPEGLFQNVVLIFAGILVVGGMAVSYVAVIRPGNIVATTQVPQSSDELGLAFDQLSRNYEWIRSQTMYAFYLSAVFMALGILVILFGSIRVIMGTTESADTLTIIAGVISEFISGSALLLYRSGSVKLNEISTRLHEAWRILAAYRLAKDLPEEIQKDAILPLIVALAGLPAKEMPSTNSGAG